MKIYLLLRYPQGIEICSNEHPKTSSFALKRRYDKS